MKVRSFQLLDATCLAVAMAALLAACLPPPSAGAPGSVHTATVTHLPTITPTVYSTADATATLPPTASAVPSPMANAPGASAAATTDATQAPSPTEISHGYRELLARAASQGGIPVIAQLALPAGPYIPEGELSAEKVREQHAAIAATREALVESLTGLNAVVYAAWESTPAVGLRVDQAALRRVIESPYVLSVQEDSPDSAQ